MSDLKYMSVADLRNEVGRLSAGRKTLMAEAQAKEAEAEKLFDEAGDLRRDYHNLVQREAWARICFARKD